MRTPQGGGRASSSDPAAELSEAATLLLGRGVLTGTDRPAHSEAEHGSNEYPENYL